MFSPASWKSKRIAERARLLHSEKLDFKSEAIVEHTCGQDKLGVDDNDRCAALLDNNEAIQVNLASLLMYMFDREQIDVTLILMCDVARTTVEHRSA